MDIKNCSKVVYFLREREQPYKALSALGTGKVQKITVIIEYLKDLSFDRKTISQVEYQLNKKQETIMKNDLKNTISKIGEEQKNCRINKCQLDTRFTKSRRLYV